MFKFQVSVNMLFFVDRQKKMAESTMEVLLSYY